MNLVWLPLRWRLQNARFVCTGSNLSCLVWCDRRLLAYIPTPLLERFFCRSLSCMHYAVHPPHARRLAWLAVVCMWLFSYFGHCGEWSRIESVGCSPMLCHCLLHNYSHWTVRRWRLTSSINAGGQQSSSCLSSVSLCRIGKWRHFRRYYPRPINDNKW